MDYLFQNSQDSIDAAKELDHKDTLRNFRQNFIFPKNKSGLSQLYFAGHSLGLMPKKAKDYINEELDSWGELGVEGHFEGKHPWLPYHENITSSFARLVGAQENEVIAMNTLTVNLHLLLVSFYRPTKTKYKIMIEHNSFPSDKYAVDSQARYHGFDPSDAIIELKPEPGQIVITAEAIEKQILQHKDSLALVLLGNCNYLSGQSFNFEKIVQTSHHVGALAGFNLAHGAGNLLLHLHDWNVDFAVWCSYKYLNSGPGGIAGAYVHNRHLGKKELPRFEGWWGQNKKTRFKMGPDFDPIPTAEAWQLSNPPIFQLASLRASMEIFDAATMKDIREKGDHLTGYFEWLLNKNLGEHVQVVSPKEARGSMLCLKIKNMPPGFAQTLRKKDIIVDFREPDIIRATPAPLYNSFADVYGFVQKLKEVLNGK